MFSVFLKFVDSSRLVFLAFKRLMNWDHLNDYPLITTSAHGIFWMFFHTFLVYFCCTLLHQIPSFNWFGLSKIRWIKMYKLIVIWNFLPGSSISSCLLMTLNYAPQISALMPLCNLARVEIKTTDATVFKLLLLSVNATDWRSSQVRKLWGHLESESFPPLFIYCTQQSCECWPAVYLQQTGASRLISCDCLLLKKLFLSISSPTLIFAFISAPLALGNVMKHISIFVGYALLCMLVHYFSFFMSLQGRFSRNAMSNMFL